MNIDFVNLTLLLAITHAKTKCVTVLVTDDVNFYLIGDRRQKGGLVFWCLLDCPWYKIFENYCLNFHSLCLHET